MPRSSHTAIRNLAAYLGLLDGLDDLLLAEPAGFHRNLLLGFCPGNPDFKWDGLGGAGHGGACLKAIQALGWKELPTQWQSWSEWQRGVKAKQGNGSGI